MKMHIFQAAFLCILFHTVLHRPRLQIIFFFPCKDVGGRVGNFPLSAEIYRIVIQRNNTHRVVALGTADHNPCFSRSRIIGVFQPLHGMRYRYRSFAQRDISPISWAHNLSQAQTRAKRKKHPETAFIHISQKIFRQSFLFPAGEHPHLPLKNLGIIYFHRKKERRLFLCIYQTE